MQYFINKKDGSHYSMAAGEVPEGCEKVKKSVYDKFVEKLDGKKIDQVKSKRDRKLKMFTGLDFQGVNISATRKDVAGLLDVQNSILNEFFKSTIFIFVNGKEIKLDAKNIGEIIKKVSLFRQSIFNQEG